MRAERTPRQRTGLLTFAATAAIVGIIGTAAAFAAGYTEQDVDLGDGSVWVVNDRLKAVGRAGTAVHELTSLVDTGATQGEVLQQGATVLVQDPARGSVAIVDPATATILDSVALPPDDPKLAFAGDRVVVASGGNVWSTSIEGFDDFDGDDEPALSFGRGSQVVVDDAGVLFAYTPSTGQVARVDAAARAVVTDRWSLPPLGDDADVQLTSVGGRWAVLDLDAGVLRFDGGAIDVSGVLGAAGDETVQEPSSVGDAVVIATRDRLVTVPLDGSEPESRAVQRPGAPSAPVLHDGCLNAAWGSGTAWRACDDGEGQWFRLGGTATSGLAYRSNGHALVLNDAYSGRTWAASADYGLIDNWDELLASIQDDTKVERDDPDTTPAVEKSQQPPVAEDDEFGARPGRSTLLPVLLNDHDVNADVLIVSSVDGVLPEGASVVPVSDRQVLQLTLDDAASGAFSFGYTISDGRGQTASATVTVAIRGPDENGPPVQARRASAVVEEGGRLTTSVLGEWVDPDGDPMYLRNAFVDGAGTVSTSPDGGLVYDTGPGAGVRSVGLVVSDGRADGGGELRVDVQPQGEADLIADPFVALATEGEEIVLEPLRHVRGGSGQVQLTAVPAKPETRLVPDYDGGTVRFSSPTARTYYLDYTVTDGVKTTTGLIRVEVSKPPERDTTPITVPHTAFLRALQPGEVDVLATDIDPTGGVLVLTGVSASAEEQGVRVEVVEHRVLRVTLSSPLESGSAEVRYRVSNGLAEAEGRVTLIEVQHPTVSEPPVANDDRVSARIGDVVDVDVLANDEHPDGDDLTLAADLEVEPEAGLLFASGDRLRYFAPERAGVYHAEYRVSAPDGQFATADVEITVRDADLATNATPVPPEVTARAFAGERVRIAIPLSGTDPDGDSVELLGQTSSPDRGVVVDRGAGWLDYEADEYASGTDMFRYEVVDALGARAEGLVRIGIAERPSEAGSPIAVADDVSVRPGRTISVRVLANDSDPAGGALSITDVTETTEGASAEIDGDRVVVRVPDHEGDFGFIYTIDNGRYGVAAAILTVHASDAAPLSRPEVTDTVLTLSDILDRDQVDVDVLTNVFIADAPVDNAIVGLEPGYSDGVRVRADGTVRVQVEDRRRIIPFSVAHPDDPSLVAHAFIWVPGRDDALPQLRVDAPQVKVRTGEEQRIDLADFVIAASGKPVRITDTASVHATHSDGTELVVDRDTLRFRSDAGYFGPASLSFTATDGESATDPEGRTGTIVIPILVEPAEGQPPRFRGTAIDFQPGDSKVIDLGLLTSTSPDPTSPEPPVYRIIDSPAAFTATLEGAQLRLTALQQARTGTTSHISIGVAQGGVAGTPGVIDLRVVPSTRPLPKPVDDRAIAVRGQRTIVDVLANDEAGNPFPGTPLRVVSVRGADAQSLPEGLRIEPSGDRSTLVITAAADTPPVNATLQYEVADATGDISRHAWGTVVVSVQDRPDPVTALRVVGFGDRRLDLAFGAGGFNNSPITGYRIELADPADGDRIGGSECAGTTCSVTTPGNGQGNGVLVRVTARNEVGDSAPVELPGPVWSDVVPRAPGGLSVRPLDGRLGVSWLPVDAGRGSSVRTYVITVAGVAAEVSAASVCTATACAVDSQPLANGSVVPVVVSARNDAYPALAAWTESTANGTPFGPPIAGSASAAADEAAGTVTVSWSAFDGNGDAIGGYFVQRLVAGDTRVPSGPQACSVTAPAPGTVVSPGGGGNVEQMIQTDGATTSATFSGDVSRPGEYTFVVWGHNRAGCVHTATVKAVVRPGPGPIGSVASTMGWLGERVWDRRIDSVASDGGRLEIVAVDAGGNLVGAPRTFSGAGWLRELLARPFGTTARFQVRSCAAWGVCGPWSDPLPAGESPSLTFDVPGLRWSAADRTWTWAGAPENSGLPAAFSCGVDDGGDAGHPSETPTSCRVETVGPWQRVWLDVEVAGVTATIRSR